MFKKLKLKIEQDSFQSNSGVNNNLAKIHGQSGSNTAPISDCNHISSDTIADSPSATAANRGENDSIIPANGENENLPTSAADSCDPQNVDSNIVPKDKLLIDSTTANFPHPTIEAVSPQIDINPPSLSSDLSISQHDDNLYSYDIDATLDDIFDNSESSIPTALAVNTDAEKRVSVSNISVAGSFDSGSQSKDSSIDKSSHVEETVETNETDLVEKSSSNEIITSSQSDVKQDNYISTANNTDYETCDDISAEPNDAPLGSHKVTEGNESTNNLNIESILSPRIDNTKINISERSEKVAKRTYSEQLHHRPMSSEKDNSELSSQVNQYHLDGESISQNNGFSTIKKKPVVGLDELEEELDTQKAHFEAVIATVIRQTNDSKSTLHHKIESYESKIKTLTEEYDIKMDKIQNQNLKLEDTISDLIEKEIENEKKYSSLEDQRNKCLMKISRKDEELKELTEKVKRNESIQMKNTESQLHLQRDLTAVRAELKTAHVTIENRDKELVKSRKEHSTVMKEFEEFKEKSILERESLDEEISAMQKQIKFLEEQTAKIQSENDDLQSKLQHCHQEIASLQSFKVKNVDMEKLITIKSTEISNLSKQCQEKSRIVKNQQQRIHELKKILQQEFRNSGGNDALGSIMTTNDSPAGNSDSDLDSGLKSSQAPFKRVSQILNGEILSSTSSTPSNSHEGNDGKNRSNKFVSFNDNVPGRFNKMPLSQNSSPQQGHRIVPSTPSIHHSIGNFDKGIDSRRKSSLKTAETNQSSIQFSDPNYYSRNNDIPNNDNRIVSPSPRSSSLSRRKRSKDDSSALTSSGSCGTMHRSSSDIALESIQFHPSEFQYLRHVVMKFLLSKESEADHLIKALSTLLKLEPADEKLLHDYLQYRQSWFATRPQYINSGTSLSSISTNFKPSVQFNFSHTSGDINTAGTSSMMNSHSRRHPITKSNIGNSLIDTLAPPRNFHIQTDGGGGGVSGSVT